MVVRNLRYRITAEDDTAQGADAIGRTLGGAFDGLAARAAAIGAALLTSIEEGANRAQETLRRVRIATGGAGEETQSLLAGLLGEGIPEDDAIAGIAALQGQAGRLGVGELNQPIATALSQVAGIGADPTSAVRGLTQFGVRGEGNVVGQLQLAFTQGLAQGVDPGRLAEGLREYGPVLAALGLNFLEAAQFISDLAQEGINFSRVSPALNRFIRDASAAGRPARSEAARVFAEIANARPTDAAALGQEYFGAEGGLRLTRAIRGGAVGLGEEQLGIDIDAALQYPTLGALVDPTSRERFEGIVAGGQVEGGLRGALASIAGSATDTPLVGGLLSGAFGRALQFAEGSAQGETIADVPAIATELADYVQALRENTMALREARPGPGSANVGDFAARADAYHQFRQTQEIIEGRSYSGPPR